MSFWAFGLSQEGGVDSLLDKWSLEAASLAEKTTSSSQANRSRVTTADNDTNSPSIGVAEDEGNEDTPVASTSRLADASSSSSVTLEQLLDEDDLLQECKNGHAKLLDFLSMPSTIKRILDYVTGEVYNYSQQLTIPSGSESNDPKHESSTTPSKSPPATISLAQQAQRVLSPKISEEEKEANRKRLKYPFLCMEILAADPFQLTEAIFSDADQYLLTFWEAILDRVPQELAEISVYAGHWSKVNIHWLSGPRAPQLVHFLKTVPNLFPRMLKHLPYVSPVFDVLVKLANTDDTHPQLGITEWLYNCNLISQVLDLLDPATSPKEAHAPASEFLRSLVAATSAAVAAKQQQQHQEAAKEINAESMSFQSTAWTNWPDNTLVRELASQKTADRLLGFMLDIEPCATEVNLTSDTLEQKAPDTSFQIISSKSSVPSPRQATGEAITSSLLNSLTVIIDIIRKNNSDFTELQIFHFLERTASGSDTGDSIGLEGEGEEGYTMQEQGPSLVDLEPLLSSITRRLPDLNRLLSHPRSDTTPRPSNLQGRPLQEPLAFERFRICELYAELIHCSNMSILNRPSATSAVRSGFADSNVPQYDAKSGRILGTRQEAFAKLSHVLNVSPAPSPILSSTIDSSHSIHDEGLGDDVPADALPNGRPVTAQSDATSSYDSDAGTISQNKDDSEDVFDQINVGTEDLSLDTESNSSRISISAAQLSPLPPSESTFSSASSASPPASTTPADSAQTPAVLEQPITSRTPLAAGPALKKAFIDLEVIPTVLDLFFKFPWNNSLHNVIYDLIQQIFNGKVEEGVNRDLCVAVFTQRGGLIERILSAVEENDRILSVPKGVRLGHMGHLTLITEEVVKLFYTHGKTIMPLVPDTVFKAARWQSYVDSSFRETRERDLQPLGGGISVGMNTSASNGSGGHGIVEIDDEFPQSGSRTLFSAEPEGISDANPEKAHFARYLASQISSDFQGPTAHTNLHRSTSSSSSSGSSSSDETLEDIASPSSPRRQPSRGPGGLDAAASAWFSTREGDSAFDDYDDDDGRSGGSAFASKNRWHGDFDIGVAPTAGASSTFTQSQTSKIHDSTAGAGRQDKFGFDDRFDSFDTAQFGSADSEDDADDDEFGPFSDSFAAAPSPGAATATVKGYAFDDDFGSGSAVKTVAHVPIREKLTPADWNSSFRTNFDGAAPSFAEFGDFSTSESPIASPNGDFQIEDDDDFGDFTGADTNNHGDYDFSQADASPKVESTSGTPPKAPSFVQASSSSPPRAMPIAMSSSPRGTAALLSSSPRNTAGLGTSPRKPPPAPPARTHKRTASSIEREHRAKNVTSPGQEIHGPGIHEGAHISSDGTHIEAQVEVEGNIVTVQVPKDELVLHPDFVDGDD